MVKILTFGDFDILLNDESIISEMGSSQSIINLLKYFLVHKDMKLLPEIIIDDLCPDEEYKNPISMLRTQISRLRKTIPNENIKEEVFFNIEYLNGYYLFTLKEACTIDFIEFEKAFSKDGENLKDYIEKNASQINELLLSYKGDFLAEVGEVDWLIPIRSKYDRLYVKGLVNYIEYLKENGMNSEIVNICERAIHIKPYEELINISFIEALLELKQNSYALIHYEFFTKKLFTDLTIVPSKKLKEVYKKIKLKEKESFSNIDLNIIDSEMSKEFDGEGIIYCDIEYFKYLYNYESRNVDRNIDRSRGTGIGVITIYNKGPEQLTEKEIKKGREQLTYTLFKKLRQGDIVTKWNNCQVIIMLYGLRKEHIESVIDKINKNFNATKLDKRLSLNIKLKIL